MLQYLVILLDDCSVSYCHYPQPQGNRKLIPIDILKKGILYGMKENLMIQFVYPKEELPEDYVHQINTIDHVDIVPSNISTNSSVIVYDDIMDFVSSEWNPLGTYVVKCSKESLFENVQQLSNTLPKVQRLNIVIDNIESFDDISFVSYNDTLSKLADKIESLLIDNKHCYLNLLTDRLVLNKMNNCNAGNTSIVLAPDGRFYPCPAFYYEKVESPQMGLGGPDNAPYSIGDINNGLDIKNQQLYKIENAPICCKCDAFQCRRCIWLNRKTTKEINTPSHEQCVVSHLERNATRKLIESIKSKGFTLSTMDIPEISYLDPLDLLLE